jgi:pimeloyl-ACP methyl ester carboxylesterase
MDTLNTMAKCSVSGHAIASRRAGEGPTVLLVHGITTYSFIWRQIFPMLRRGAVKRSCENEHPALRMAPLHF